MTFSFYVLGKHQEGIPETKEYCITWVGGWSTVAVYVYLVLNVVANYVIGSNEVLLLVGWSLFLVRPKKKNKATTSRRRSKEGKKKQEITIVRDKINRFSS